MAAAARGAPRPRSRPAPPPKGGGVAPDPLRRAYPPSRGVRMPAACRFRADSFRRGEPLPADLRAAPPRQFCQLSPAAAFFSAVVAFLSSFLAAPSPSPDDLALARAASVVGRVEARALEVHRHRVENLGQRPLAAHLADLRVRVGHPVEHLEEMAVRATVFVDGHGETQGYQGRPRPSIGRKVHRGDERDCHHGRRRRAAALARPQRGRRSRPPPVPRPASPCLHGRRRRFLVVQLSGWPPHEDETLPLFVGRQPLGGLFDIVLGERGGAPLHFLLAWVVAHAGGGLDGDAFASPPSSPSSSLPAIAALGNRLAGRAPGSRGERRSPPPAGCCSSTGSTRGCTACSSSSPRSRTSRCCARSTAAARAPGSSGRVVILLTIGAHPYGALVLGSQGLYVLLTRDRLRQAIPAFAAVLVLAIPLWRSSLVLASRFDVGLGGGGGKLRTPRAGAPLPLAGRRRLRPPATRACS